MAELRLDEFGVGPLGDQERSISMPQVVEPDLPEACPGKRRPEFSSDQIPALQRSPFRATEHEIMRAHRTLEPLPERCIARHRCNGDRDQAAVR